MESSLVHEKNKYSKENRIYKIKDLTITIATDKMIGN